MNMETFHRLVGMTETSGDPNEQPSQPIPQPPPIPQDADDAGVRDDASSQHRSTRSALPLSRRKSQKSMRSGKSVRSGRSKRRSGDDARPEPEGYPPVPTSPLPPQSAGGRAEEEAEPDEGEEEDDEDDFTWGPTHPCFPHPNTHCAPTSREAQTTRVIRVRRDWLQAGDLYPQYANLYPEILDPLVSDEDFRFLIANLNSRLQSALDPFAARAWIDGALGMLTGYLWEDVGWTGAKRGVRGLEAFIEGWNRGKERQGKEVRLVQLRRTGFMSLDFVIPDPGIDVVAPDEEDGEEEEMEGGIGPAE